MVQYKVIKYIVSMYSVVYSEMRLSELEPETAISRLLVQDNLKDSFQWEN